jgi:hypothetical protein
MEHWVVVAPIVAIAARVGAAAARNCPAATVDTGAATNTPHPRLYEAVSRRAVHRTHPNRASICRIWIGS